MLRAKPIDMCALGAMLVGPAAACTSPDASSAADVAPLVGRLQTREGVNDLTVRSFADGPHAVPTSSVARVVADIAPSVRHDSDDERNNGADTDFTGRRGF